MRILKSNFLQSFFSIEQDAMRTNEKCKWMLMGCFCRFPDCLFLTDSKDSSFFKRTNIAFVMDQRSERADCSAYWKILKSIFKCLNRFFYTKAKPCMLSNFYGSHGSHASVFS